MDKAAKAVRRSGIRLLNMGGGHSDLSVLISEVKDMRSTAKAYMTAQNSAAQYMLKWAANEDNRAIQDVAFQLAELNLVWTEVQQDLCDHLKDFRQMFEMILDGEKHVTQAKVNLIADHSVSKENEYYVLCAVFIVRDLLLSAREYGHLVLQKAELDLVQTTCEVRETKTKKELKKAAKKATVREIQILEHNLSQAERAKDMAQLEVIDRLRENEAIKLLRLKEGMLRFSAAYVNYGKKCTMLFQAQHDISNQLPDIVGRDLEDIKYTGTGATKFYVQKAKENVQRYNRQSQQPPQPSQENMQNDPPPPYSPSDYLRHPGPMDDQRFPYPEVCVISDLPDLSLPPTNTQSTHNSQEHNDDDGDELSGAMGAAKL